MELLHILNTLWRLRIRVAVGAVIAVLASIAVLYEYAPPFKLSPRSIEYGAAETQILIDTSQSPLTDVQSDIGPLSSRAQVYAQLVESPPVAATIARAAGVPVETLLLSSQVEDTTGTRSSRESLAEQRANEIRGEAMPDRLLFSAGGGLPIISVYAQASDAKRALRLADGGAKGLTQYLEALAAKTPPARRATFRQLGPAEGGMVNSGASRQVAALAFLAIFGAWCAALLVLSNVFAAFRASKARADELAVPDVPSPHADDAFRVDVGAGSQFDERAVGIPVGHRAGDRG